MICFRVFLLICAALIWLSANPAQAGDLPAKVVKALQERDRTLNHLTSSWRLSDKEQTFCSLPPTQLETMRKKMEVGFEADYRKRGIIDEAKIKHDVQDSVQNIMTALQGGAVAYTNVWSFQRDGSTALISGTTQSFNGFISTFRQFYDKDSAVTVFDDNHSVKGLALPKLTPIAWRTSGESISYPVSSSASLDLSPEHLVFLLGSNPLSLRGLDWKLQSQSPASLVLNSIFNVEHTTYSIRMILAVKNGFAPSEIVVQSGHNVERYTASSFRRYKDTWIGDRVEYSKDAPGFVRVAQVWNLQSLTASPPIEFKIAGHEFVRDFRLVGPDLSSTALDKAGMRQDSRFGKIVYYQWPGHFPSDEEVKQIYQKQHPGEATPDPKSSASLPFVGGLLCLVGGVWMFKRRGVS